MDIQTSRARATIFPSRVYLASTLNASQTCTSIVGLLSDDMPLFHAYADPPLPLVSSRTIPCSRLHSIKNGLLFISFQSCCMIDRFHSCLRPCRALTRIHTSSILSLKTMSPLLCVGSFDYPSQPQRSQSLLFNAQAHCLPVHRHVRYCILYFAHWWA